MILVEIGLDKVDGLLFTVDNQLLEHADYHLFLLNVEPLLALVLRNVRWEELAVQLFKR